MLAVFSIALVLLSAALFRRFGLAWLRGVEPDERTPEGPWSSAHLLLIVGVGVIAQVMAGSLLGLFAQARGIALPDVRAGVVLLTNAFWQGTLVTVLLLIARNSSSGLASLGLGRVRPKPILVGLAIYVIATPAIFGSSALWSLALEHWGGEAPSQAVQELIARSRGADIALAAGLAIVVIPFLEEVLFRGWLQGWISHRLDSTQGVLIPAFLFAVLHGTAVLVPIFSLALVLGIVRHHTKSLVPVWAIHALHNGSQLAFLFLVADSENQSASAWISNCLVYLVP